MPQAALFPAGTAPSGDHVKLPSTLACALTCLFRSACLWNLTYIAQAPGLCATRDRAGNTHSRHSASCRPRFARYVRSCQGWNMWGFLWLVTDFALSVQAISSSKCGANMCSCRLLFLPPGPFLMRLGHSLQPPPPPPCRRPLRRSSTLGCLPCAAPATLPGLGT